MARLTKKNSSGFALIEALLGVLIGAVILGAFVELGVRSSRLSHANRTEVTASLMVRGAMEAVKDLEQSDWSELSNCPTLCHQNISGGAWELASGSENLDYKNTTFTRAISLTSVDANTYFASTTVSWNNGLSDRNLTLQSYLYNN